jgi:DNA-binding NtrC family response regulator
MGLENIIRQGFLPYFIENLQFDLDPGKPQSSQDAKPNLSPLLDMASPDEAIVEFKRYCYQHHMKKNDNNKKKAAQSLGISESALKQRIERLK